MQQMTTLSGLGASYEADQLLDTASLQAPPTAHFLDRLAARDHLGRANVACDGIFAFRADFPFSRYQPPGSTVLPDQLFS